MPIKIRQLIAELQKAGFTLTSAKGSHRKYRKDAATVIISGKAGDDALHYQEKDVRRAMAAAEEKAK